MHYGKVLPIEIKTAKTTKGTWPWTTSFLAMNARPEMQLFLATAQRRKQGTGRIF